MREGLAEAAFELFVEKGFERTTVDDIVARAGVGRRSFFRYFPSKEDVVFPDHESCLAETTAFLAAAEASEIADGRDAADPIGTVCEAARIVLSMYAAKPEFSVQRYRLTRRCRGFGAMNSPSCAATSRPSRAISGMPTVTCPTVCCGRRWPPPRSRRRTTTASASGCGRAARGRLGGRRQRPRRGARVVVHPGRSRGARDAGHTRCGRPAGRGGVGRAGCDRHGRAARNPDVEGRPADRGGRRARLSATIGTQCLYG